MEKKLIFSVSRIFLPLFMSFFFAVSVVAQDVTIRGNVKEKSSGEPVIGASVTVKGTSLGVATNFEGNFVLENVPAVSTIIINYLGFVPVELTVTDPSTPLSILMIEDAQLLEEVVVIGYGTMKKSDLTGSITSIGEKDFQKGLVTNPASLITGKVAGVQITSTGGRAGSGNQIRIRGGASLNASNDPLIVIDGVPMDNGG
ncbi:MAG: carboxypeptidase-like regulatory domain-containing protein, partial [Dysgonamonadaceae bacterium]|nr:carboxypeptidase-like regulatory domain-containing protein [Dysgonamonadaceae bacterium]